MICKKLSLKGTVQGVGLRQATVKKAKEIGAYGYVQNESDGSVTILVCGTDRELRLMEKWIKDQGTPGFIESYTAQEYPNDDYKDFTVHY